MKAARGTDTSHVRRESEVVSQKLFVEQVKQLYGLASIGLFGAWLGSVAVVVALWTVVSHQALITWFACYTAVLALRYVLIKAFHKASPKGAEISWWNTRLHILTTVGGLFWGLTAIFLFPANYLEYQCVLLIMVAGIVSAAIVVFYPTHCFVTVIPAETLPFIARFFFEGGHTGVVLGSVILLFTVALLFAGRRLHNTNKESLRLRFEKDQLVDTLWSQKVIAEDLNRKLKSEIAERVRAENSLRDSERRYRTLVETARDVIWTVNLELQYTYVSPSVVDLTGYTVEETMAMNALDLITPQSREQLLEILQQEKDLKKQVPDRGSETFTEEIEIYHKNGSTRTVEISFSFLRDDDHSLLGVLGISRDISQRKLAAKNLERALATATKLRAEAEVANLARNEFLANINHELRTPLNAIIGFSEILRDQIFGELNDKQRKHINHVVNSGNHLLQLINEILDLSNVETGEMELHLTRVRVPGLIQTSLLIVGETVLKKGLTTTLHVGSELEHVYLSLDPVKIKQIMFHLLSNATKFTPAGGSIEIEACIENKELKISVKDTGIGVSKENRELIFHRFQQVDSSYSRLQPGTGLGLTLSRRLAELHGGRIWVESEGLGKGSTFILVIPAVVEECDEPNQPDALNPAKFPATAQHR